MNSISKSEKEAILAKRQELIHKIKASQSSNNPTEASNDAQEDYGYVTKREAMVARILQQTPQRVVQDENLEY